MRACDEMSDNWLRVAVDTPNPGADAARHVIAYPAATVNDRLHYDLLVDDALRGVVRRVLSDVAANGLPGAHHFYVSFRTNDPGVAIPDYLRTKYPEDMTIVLQHRYWGLEV